MHLPRGLVALLVATPLILATRKVSFQDNFDNRRLTVLPVGAAVDDTAGGALFYNSFGYNDLTTNPLLKADTTPTVVGGGVTLGVTEGQRLWRPMNSSIVSFDEKSIAYACLLYLVTGTSNTISCTIQLAGKKKDTGATVVQDLVYNPGLLGTFMNKTAIASTFKNLVEVDVTLGSSPVGDALTVVVIDSHAYDAYFA